MGPNIDDSAKVNRWLICCFDIRWHRNTVLHMKNQATRRRWGPPLSNCDSHSLPKTIFA